MPSDNNGLNVVQRVIDLFSDTLVGVENLKPAPSIDPALSLSDFGDVLDYLDALFVEDEGDRYENLPEDVDKDRKKQRRNAVVESATRITFAKLIAETTIDSPKFMHVWNLLDLLSILSDHDRCEPALIFWIIEELLDTQTIAGCRQVFDYLESRRERITAKNFKAKHLVILRTCNELLRRLSRAKDTSFCGRVFIFMFQSFPLGDKSSVNLRGEYHIENVTTYDQDKPAEMEEGQGDAMEVDEKVTPEDQYAVDFESLYPVFWSLQDTFSQPKKLFEPEHFERFKEALQTSLKAFRALRETSSAAPTSVATAKAGSEEPKRASVPRLDRNSTPSHTINDDKSADGSTFNPKYLTSRDLFELEMNDLSFRRHVLVQALIIMDFIASLTAKSKEKLFSLSAVNKSVAYIDQVVSEKDAQWAIEIKSEIVEFLRRDSEGFFYLRVVETVLSRDKNWVRWKVENCLPIEIPAISPEVFVESIDSLARLTTTRKPKMLPLSGLSLDFLDDPSDSEETNETDVATPADTVLPNIQEFRGKLGDIDFDLDMENDSSKKAMLEDRKAGATWQALRLTSRTHIAAFDRIDSVDNIDAIYGEKLDPDAALEPTLEGNAKMPEDLKLVLLAGEEATGHEELLRALLEKYPAIFKRVPRHTTKPKIDDEEAGAFIHVDKKTYMTMLDGDQLAESVGDIEADEDFEGLSKRSIAGIEEKGKVPIAVVPYDSIEWMVDVSGYSARSILVKAPSSEIVEALTKASGLNDEKAAALGKRFSKVSEKEGYDKGFGYVLVHENVESSLKKIMKLIYGEDPDSADETTEAKEDDTEMGDAQTTAVEASTEEESQTKSVEFVDEDDIVDLVKVPLESEDMDGVEEVVVEPEQKAGAEQVVVTAEETAAVEDSKMGDA